MQIHAIGSFVRLETGGEPQKAQITGVMIREGEKVSYEVVWWGGTTRNCAWVESCEVDASESGMPDSVIGFGAEYDALEARIKTGCRRTNGKI